MQFPEGHVCDLRPRSGQGWKRGLTLINAPGSGDADFPGEYAALVVNLSFLPLRIHHLERVAQLVFLRHEEAAFEDGPVVQTTDRAGGFGHTGR